ncbi:hypothetical protein ACHHYP_15497 [Achlya hypogyna]|uniref:K Homology domain-containing protein n=1 Tax=Achlya hypogyna TaxID=1202772 RepID=A0A1V9ZET9_ACHHY|nr:hypothetical protein ACHHYP_15497 [Achlya hypogyna]
MSLRETRTFLLAPADVASQLERNGLKELRDLTRSAGVKMYFVDGVVDKDERILSVAGSTKEIQFGLQLLMDKITEWNQHRFIPTFDTYQYMHGKAVVHIPSSFASMLLHHRNERLDNIKADTHTNIYISKVDDMPFGSSMRRLHVSGDEDDVRAAAKRLGRLQSDFNKTPQSQGTKCFALKLVLLDRDLPDVKNENMQMAFDAAHVRVTFKESPSLNRKTIAVIFGMLENVFHAHEKIMFALMKTLDKVRLIKQQSYGASESALPKSDSQTSMDRHSVDRRESSHHRTSSEPRGATNAILPTPLKTPVEMKVSMDVADKIMSQGLRRLAQASNAKVSFETDPNDVDTMKIIMFGDLMAVMRVQQEINIIMQS